MSDRLNSSEKRPVSEPDTDSGEAKPDSDPSRRAFLKKLAYVPPVIETIYLLSDTGTAYAASPIGNEPPPPGPAPTVTGCSPSSGAKGQNMNVTVTGTNFVDEPEVDFGFRIQTTGVSFVSSTSLIASIRIKNNATTGTRDVVVTNPDAQSGTGVACFTVTT
jgi:hypothetical protein